MDRDILGYILLISNYYFYRENGIYFHLCNFNFMKCLLSWFNILEYYPLFCFIHNVINAYVVLKGNIVLAWIFDS